MQAKVFSLGAVSNKAAKLSATKENRSIWLQLKQGKITCEAALGRLVSDGGVVNIEYLDPDLDRRFVRLIAGRKGLPPVLPLLLWQNCYYLGSPAQVTEPELEALEKYTHATVQILPVSDKSYRHWLRLQSLVQTLHKGRKADSAGLHTSTHATEPDEIAEVTELYLSQAADQIERIKLIISSALESRASDIHLEPSPSGLRVRYRIDGILRHITTLPPEMGRRVIVSLKVMCDMDIAESRRPQDGRISENYMGEQEEEWGLDLRVSTLPCVSSTKNEFSEKAVLRLLRQNNTFTTLTDLGFVNQTRSLYEHWISQPQGMVILTGPTGSGKTSTLYTSLQQIATDSINVITVEDPVEYVLPGITQTQVHEAAGMTFAAGLRAILRQDPDVIMVGEIRDAETAETAVRAALTGHLVLTTLHTNDAVGAIPRLKDIGPDPGLISDALLGVIAQRLVRCVCPHCAEPHTPTPAELALLGLPSPQGNWRKGKGCSKCFNTGYAGRQALIEMLHVDDQVRSLIYEGTITQLNQYLVKTGFHSFRRAAVEKVVQGVTTVDEIKRVLPSSALQRREAHMS